MAKKLSEYMLDADKIPLITDLPKACYEMPAAMKKVELFKGAVFNVSELADQLKKSPSIECLFEERIRLILSKAVLSRRRKLRSEPKTRTAQ